MFIPINAKADIVGSKKGKLTPAQNAQVNAWTLSKKTGIFNAFDKCEATVSTPVANVVTVTFKRGYLSICGRIVEVEEGSTVSITLPIYSYDGKIVARFNLSASQEYEFLVVATPDEIVQEDLNSNIGGRYDFVLYEYTASPSGVTLKPRADDIYIDDISTTINNLVEDLEKGTIKVSNAIWANVASKANKAELALYIDGDPDKLETIDRPRYTLWERYDQLYKRLVDLDERLVDLGFKQGSVSGLAGATIKKQGKYAILNIPAISNKPNIITMNMSFTIAQPLTLTVHGDTGLFATLSISGKTINYNGGYQANMPALQIGFEISDW